MGCAPTVTFCADCGEPGGVQLIGSDGKVHDGFYCWDCSQKRTTPIPEDARSLRAVLVFLDPLWVKSRPGALWLAKRIAAHDEQVQRRQSGRAEADA